MKQFLICAAIVIGIGQGISGIAMAAQNTFSHSVKINVPPTITLTGSQKDVALAFPNSASGAETNTATVVYTVNSNGMMQADGAPVVTAQLDGAFTGIEFKASVGSYAKEGGNTELASLTSGFTTVRDSPTGLAAKANSTNGGRLLKGSFPVSYKAVATTNLASGNFARQLTITLTDI